MDVSSSRRSNSFDTVLIILDLSFGWKKTTNSRWSSEISESDRAFCRARWLHHPSEKRDALVVQMSSWKYHQKMSETTRVIHIHLTLCTCSRKNVPAPYPQPLKPQLCSLPIRCFGTMSMRSMSKWKRFLGGDKFLVTVVGIATRQDPNTQSAWHINRHDGHRNYDTHTESMYHVWYIYLHFLLTCPPLKGTIF